MARQLLVGLAEANLNEPRRALVGHLELLSALGVDIQVALFEDGPVRRDLEAVADVRLMAEPSPRSPGGLIESMARRLSNDLSDRVHDARVRADLAWVRSPDSIHVHGPKAAPVLRYARDPRIPVTTYAHHLDFSVAGLQPLDLRRLLARTSRFLVDGSVARAALVAAGAEPAHVMVAGDPRPLTVPAAAARREALRVDLGLPLDASVVGVLPVTDWADAPDLTLSLAWELERLAGPRAPLIYWFGMPDEGEARWSIEFDIDRIGLRSVKLDHAEPSWTDLIEMVDVVVLPSRTTAVLPQDFATSAAMHACPVACWDGSEASRDVASWGGAVFDVGDVSAMAAHVAALTSNTASLRQERERLWRLTLTEVERITPLDVPFPVPEP